MFVDSLHRSALDSWTVCPQALLGRRGSTAADLYTTFKSDPSCAMVATGDFSSNGATAPSAEGFREDDPRLQYLKAFLSAEAVCSDLEEEDLEAVAPLADKFKAAHEVMSLCAEEEEEDDRGGGIIPLRSPCTPPYSGCLVRCDHYGNHFPAWS